MQQCQTSGPSLQSRRQRVLCRVVQYSNHWGSGSGGGGFREETVLHVYPHTTIQNCRRYRISGFRWNKNRTNKCGCAFCNVCLIGHFLVKLSGRVSTRRMTLAGLDEKETGRGNMLEIYQNLHRSLFAQDVGVNFFPVCTDLPWSSHGLGSVCIAKEFITHLKIKFVLFAREFWPQKSMPCATGSGVGVDGAISGTSTNKRHASSGGIVFPDACVSPNILPGANFTQAHRLRLGTWSEPVFRSGPPGHREHHKSVLTQPAYSGAPSKQLAHSERLAHSASLTL